MKRNLTRVRLALVFLLLLAVGSGSVSAQNALTITDGSAEGLSSSALSVLMDADAPVEGYVLAITFDTGLLSVSDVEIGSATSSAGAELIAPEILAGGFTLGVVLDFEDPFGGQTIPAGTGLEIASFSITPLTIVSAPTDTPIEFIDGVLNDPVLDNIIVQGGLTIGVNEGLGLNNGTMTLLPPPPDGLAIEGVIFPSDASGEARILMSNSSGPVQGFVLAIAHDTDQVTLTQISIAGTVTSDVGAELVVPQVYATGGTLGVVLDFGVPFDGQSIAIGIDQHIASFVYSSNEEIIIPAPDETSTVSFADGQLGGPLLDNVLVVAGLSISPGLENGTLTRLAVDPPPVHDTAFYIGQIDFPDTGTQGGQGFPGMAIEFCFFYTDPTDNIQGVQIAVCYDDLEFLDGTFTIEGSIADELGAEFVNYQIDNDETDGDGREFLLGILMDALPPFENQQLPPTSEPLLIGCVQAEVLGGAVCGDTFSVDFCDGINGNGMVLINNLVVIDYQSIENFERFGATYEIIPVPSFRRGDCNTDERVDLADAATVIASQFQGFPVECDDACDSNDDGTINLADSVYLLNFLFQFGDLPPDPGPYSTGPDPTLDDLDCALPAACN
ncbi:MAG TPA: hypothetical protein EYN79_04095 [Planctomycetes bacterium]|nr:hypothetical protein [Planctomycetota bacterium]HIN80459.1 hypothetical protein [Planctomycetota bacterium]